MEQEEAEKEPDFLGWRLEGPISVLSLIVAVLAFGYDEIVNRLFAESYGSGFAFELARASFLFTGCWAFYGPLARLSLLLLYMARLSQLISTAAIIWFGFYAFVYQFFCVQGLSFVGSVLCVVAYITSAFAPTFTFELPFVCICLLSLILLSLRCFLIFAVGYVMLSLAVIWPFFGLWTALAIPRGVLFAMGTVLLLGLYFTSPKSTYTMEDYRRMNEVFRIYTKALEKCL